MPKHHDLTYNKIKHYFFVPVKDQLQKLYTAIFALVILLTSNALILFMMQPFFQVLFKVGPDQDVVKLIEFIPKNFQVISPHLENFTLDVSTLIWISPVILLFAGLLKNLATYIYQVNQQGISLWVAKTFRDKLFQAIVKQDLTDNLKHSSSKWMSIIMNDVMFLQNRFSDLCNAFIKDSVVIISTTMVMFFIHWQTSLFLIALSPFVSFGMGKIGKQIAFYADAFQKELAKMANVVLDLRRRFHFIRVQNGEATEEQAFAKYNDQYYFLMRRSIFIRSAFAPGMEFLGFALFALAIIAIDQNWISQENLGKNLIVFLAALGTILRPLRNLGEQYSKLQETKGILSESINILETPTPLSVNTDENDTLKESNFIIKEITCGYDHTPQFSASNLEITSGKTIAVIGPSGSGKSTLIKTLSGLLKPIHWQGNINSDLLSSEVSMVSQSPYLFQDSLKTNILYGNQNPSLQEGAIWQALKSVSLYELVKELPNGLDTDINSIDSNISGGQKQRLVIARAILRQFQILVLDEATSAVDSKTEQDIIRTAIAIAKNYKKTLISITHRHQTLGLFDEIWFIQDGKIALRGQHHTLLENKSYREFCGSAF